MTKYSIIVPVYNSEDYIEDCIQSLLEQTYSDFEVIIINDCSTDNSFRICKKFEKKYPFIRVYNNLKNKGVSYSRNVGIKKSRAEYLMFLDSDDLLDKNSLELFNGVISKGKYDMVMANYDTFPISGIYLKELNQDLKMYNVKDLCDNFSYFFNNNIIIGPTAKIYRKDLIYNYFEEDINIGEDLLFNAKYIKNVNKLFYLNEIVYYYRINNYSLTSSFKKNRFKNLKIVYEESLKTYNYIFKEYTNVNYENEIKNKYLIDICVAVNKLAINKKIKYKNKINILKENLSNINYNSIINDEWNKKRFIFKLLINLLKLKMYNFIVISIILKEVISKYK